MFCSQVSELKRINRLQNDKDFHALKDVKIPVKPHSVLEDILKQEAAENNLIDHPIPSMYEHEYKYIYCEWIYSLTVYTYHIYSLLYKILSSNTYEYEHICMIFPCFLRLSVIPTKCFGITVNFNLPILGTTNHSRL